MMRFVAIPSLVLAMAAALPSCSGEGGGSDTDAEQICTSGRLRCDPEGTQVLQRCSGDGTAWEEFQACELCHDSMCFGTLDGTSG